MARGITKETRSKAAKQFSPSMDINKGLSLAYLTWDLTTREVSADSKQTSFIGLERPTLRFIFTGVTEKENEEAPIYIHSYSPVEDDEPSRETIEDGMFQMLKHFLETILGRELQDKEYDLLILDIPENPSGEDVLAGYKKFFEGVLTILEPVSKEELRKKELYWVKLLRYVTTTKGLREVNRGNVGLPAFPGTGVIEKYVSGIEPSLEINIAKGEKIEPIEKSAAAAPAGAAPTMPSMGTTTATTTNAGNGATIKKPAWMQK